MKPTFLSAIHGRKKIRVTFFSKEDGCDLVRKCAPMDLGPSRRTHDQSDRFHFWDYESDKRNHTLSLLPDQLRGIELLDESFDPSEFITWDTKASPWFVARDWGVHS